MFSRTEWCGCFLICRGKGRITGITSHEGAVSYTYGENGNVLTVRDGHGTVTRAYDANNHVVGDDFVEKNNNFSFFVKFVDKYQNIVYNGRKRRLPSMKYFCPICGKRICDSNKMLTLSRLSEENAEDADVALKCHICKKEIALFLISPIPHPSTT